MHLHVQRPEHARAHYASWGVIRVVRVNHVYARQAFIVYCDGADNLYAQHMQLYTQCVTSVCVCVCVSARNAIYLAT